jgi:ribose-phosphate pyrophosphokinase
MGLDIILFSGRANARLAAAIARDLGVAVGRCSIDRFADGETSVRLEESVTGRDVVLVQPTSPPVNDHLVELLALADACRRGVAARITAVIPYYGYARSDKRHNELEPIMARVVADLLQSVGISHLVTMDLHTDQIEGFFRVPVDSLTALESLCAAVRPQLPPDFVVVAPDAGRATLAARYAQCLGAEVVVLHKRRTREGVEMVRVVGDVAGRACLLIDDMISTGGTIAQAAKVLVEKGARPGIVVAATHGLFIGPARERLDDPAVKAVFVTDTIAPSVAGWDKLRVVPVGDVFAAAVRRYIEGLHRG